MLTDLHLYESEAERHAVCAELARMLRIVPVHLSPATSDPGRNPLPAPEGIVIFHVAGRVGFKKTIEKDDVPKSLAK